MEKIHMLKLLALNTVKARYINESYKLHNFDVSDEYKQQVLTETTGEINAYKALGEVIDSVEYKKQCRRYRKEMLEHMENYQLVFLNDMIEYFEGLIANDSDSSNDK